LVCARLGPYTSECVHERETTTHNSEGTGKFELPLVQNMLTHYVFSFVLHTSRCTFHHGPTELTRLKRGYDSRAVEQRDTKYAPYVF
jgi:hypothetical protein